MQKSPYFLPYLCCLIAPFIPNYLLKYIQAALYASLSGVRVRSPDKNTFLFIFSLNGICYVVTVALNFV